MSKLNRALITKRNNCLKFKPFRKSEDWVIYSKAFPVGKKKKDAFKRFYLVLFYIKE